jgi:transcription elongation factor Elf1
MVLAFFAYSFVWGGTSCHCKRIKIKDLIRREERELKIDEEFTCPYCGKTMWHNGIWLNESGNVKVECWEEDGGCGKYFIAKGKHVLTFTVYKMEDYR